MVDVARKVKYLPHLEVTKCRGVRIIYSGGGGRFHMAVSPTIIGEMGNQ
jgi:hypothetical protein